MIDTILFDLDGTLLPVEQEEFIKVYFHELVKRISPRGYDKDELVQAIWFGTKAMLENDGQAPNYNRFWDAFVSALGADARRLEDELEDFYSTDFNRVRSIIKDIPDVKSLIQYLREKKYFIILATNPIFPLAAIKSRLSWIGLSTDDFDEVTSYTTSCFCKPNPEYFKEILQKIGRSSQQCVMIGNNPLDDMSAKELGMEAFLLTDHLESAENVDIARFNHGNFDEMVAFLKAINLQ